MPSRRCASDAYLKDIWAPTRRQREDIEAYRTLAREGRRPTLALIAQQLGVRRQTVWQMEQLPAFRAGLLGHSDRAAAACGTSGLETPTSPPRIFSWSKRRLPPERSRTSGIYLPLVLTQ